MLAGANGLGRDICVFVEFLIGAGDAGAVKKGRFARVHGEVAGFLDARQTPFVKGDFADVAAALGCGAAALLLRAVDPVGKTIVGDDVIELRSRLVVPTAPSLPAVDADDRALIAGQRDGLGIPGIDPDALVVVAAGRAFEAHKGLPGVGGFPCGGVGDIDEVGIVWRNGDAHGARPAATDAVIPVDMLPAFAGIVGAVDAGLFLRLGGQIHALGIAGSDGDTDAAKQVVRSGKAFRYLPPGAAAIRGFV